MPARSTRQEARARILAAFSTQLDRLIPEDESVPLKGATFADFENQVEDLARAALALNEDWGTHLCLCVLARRQVDGKQIQPCLPTGRVGRRRSVGRWCRRAIWRCTPSSREADRRHRRTHRCCW